MMSNPLTIVAIVAAYNEEDVIAEVVRALIEEGVLVYFLDHHSTDGTLAQVEPFLGRGVIGIERFPADGIEDESRHSYTWEEILRRKEQLAQTLDADWFVHHDADEFRESPWSGQTLSDGIRRVDSAGYNAIDFQVLNFFPTTADPSGHEEIRKRLLFYEPGRMFDRQQIKCWKKTAQPVVLTKSGGHSVQFAGRRVFPIRFLLRHYPIRSQVHGERKVFRERLPRFVPRERARGWHVQYDDVVVGATFVRESESLLRYDPEAVRLDLFRRNRDVERLERVAAESRDLVDQLTAQNAELRRHLQVLEGELDSLRREREQLQRELDMLTSARLRESLAIFRLDGALKLASEIDGVWNDRWAGTDLRFRATAVSAMSGLRIAGIVPAELIEGQDLTLRIDHREWTYHAPPGDFEWLVPVTLDPQEENRFQISASRSWQPSSTGTSADDRDLAWYVVDIERSQEVGEGNA